MLLGSGRSTVSSGPLSPAPTGALLNSSGSLFGHAVPAGTWQVHLPPGPRRVRHACPSQLGCGPAASRPHVPRTPGLQGGVGRAETESCPSVSSFAPRPAPVKSKPLKLYFIIGYSVTLGGGNITHTFCHFCSFMGTRSMLPGTLGPASYPSAPFLPVLSAEKGCSACWPLGPVTAAVNTHNVVRNPTDGLF